MPTPTKLQLRENKKDEFIQKCIRQVKNERNRGENQLTDSQIIGRCYGIWERAKEKND